FLAPLAHMIVEQRVPEGDQFLFVTAAPSAGVTVTFVDPDEDAEIATDEVVGQPAPLDLRTVALTPSGDKRTAQFLLEELQRIATAIHSDAVRGRKEAALAAMSRDGFWEDEHRVVVLNEVEHLDRLQAALQTAEKLGDRLRN